MAVWGNLLALVVTIAMLAATLRQGDHEKAVKGAVKGATPLAPRT
jgi:hypothetical protein